jgi:hypothetical protein
MLYLDVSKVDRCLLLALCCLASFSDCGEGATRVGEGGAPGAGGRDAPGDCGMDASARRLLLLRGQVGSPLVFYFTQDTEMIPLVGHNASPRFGWLRTGRCVWMRSECWMSGRQCPLRIKGPVSQLDWQLDQCDSQKKQNMVK